MNDKIIRRNIKLGGEFDHYVLNSPTAHKRIPHKANIVLTSAADKELSDANIALAQHSRGTRFVRAHKTSRGWRISEFVR